METERKKEWKQQGKIRMETGRKELITYKLLETVLIEGMETGRKESITYKLLETVLIEGMETAR